MRGHQPVPRQIGSRVLCHLLVLVLLCSAQAVAAAPGKARHSSTHRHLLVHILQQPIQPGLELAHTDLQSSAAPALAAQPKALSSFTAIPTTGTFSGIAERAQQAKNASSAAPPAGPASNTTAASPVVAPSAPTDAGGSPQDPQGWQRRTMQLPPHVYLISFVMLLAIMAALLSCHCYRMCRIARRMRRAAELGITLTPSGATLNKRTPQSVIESLPVSKYAQVHSIRAASRTASMTKPSAAASAGAAGSGSTAAPGCTAPVDSTARTTTDKGPVAACSSSGSGPQVLDIPQATPNAAVTEGTSSSGGSRVQAFMAAAAMQIREQVSRQVGISTMPPSHATGTGAAAATAADSMSSSSPSNGPHVEITTWAAPPAAAVAAEGPSLLVSTAAANDAQAAAAVAPPAAAAAAAASGSVPAGVQPSSSGGAEPCAICFDEFAADDDVKQLPCGHYFHPGCIDEWLIRDITCPLCKGMVLDESLVEQQEIMAVALQGSLLTSTTSISRRLRARAAQQAQQQELAVEESAAAARSRRRRLRRLTQASEEQHAAAAAAAAAASSTAAGGTASRAGSGSATATTAAAARPPARSNTDELLELLHMVMLGFPRMHTYAVSNTAEQQQQQQDQSASAGRSGSSSGRGGWFGRQQQQQQRFGADVELGLGASISALSRR